MTKTVAEVVKEYRNRLNKPLIEEMILKVGDSTLVYKQVVNFKILGGNKISFDYNDRDPILGEDYTYTYIDNWKHVVCNGDVLLMQGDIEE